MVVVCTETSSWGGGQRGIGVKIGPGGGDEGGHVNASELKFESVRRRPGYTAGSLLEKKGFAHDP
jgi:hypothetical protein